MLLLSPSPPPPPHSSLPLPSHPRPKLLLRPHLSSSSNHNTPSTSNVNATSDSRTKPNLNPYTLTTTIKTSPKSPAASTPAAHDAALLSLLRQRKTSEAYALFLSSPHLPSSASASRLLSQLSYSKSLPLALNLLRRLRSSNSLHLLDSNSLSLLISASPLPLSLRLLRHLLSSHHLPHVIAWSSVLSQLSHPQNPHYNPALSLRLFDHILNRIRSISPPSLAALSRPDTAAFNVALNACANVGDLDKFCKVFGEMPEWGVQPDAISFNVLIKMCARVGRKDLLCGVVERILRSGLVPCVTTFHSLVAAYVGLGDIEMAERIVQGMRDGRLDICAILRDDVESGGDDADDGEDSANGNSNGILNNDKGEEHKLLEKIVRDFDVGVTPPLLPKTYSPDSRIYTTLMKGYMNEGRVDDVVRTIQAMQQLDEPGSRPDHVTYTTVISALVKVGAMSRAHNVLAEMMRAGVPANRVTYNVLLKGYCEQLQLGKAKELMREMEELVGVEPNVVSYNILIDGCILVDDNAGALAFFNEMRKKGIAPTKVSYTTLMKAFALSGQPKLAHKVFDEMDKDPRVKVDRVAYNMLIEGYCRLGLIEEAKKIIAEMKESGMQPDVATYGSLANGIALARKPGEALLLWTEVKERCEASPSFKPDEGLLGALADVCVRAAFFRKALEIVACMEEYGISPNKIRYKKIYVEMHSKMFTSKHASQARRDRRKERKNAAEAFKFWLGLPNSYYGSEWRLEPMIEGDEYADT